MTIFKYLWLALLVLAYTMWTAYIIWLKVKFYDWELWLDDDDVQVWLTIHIGAVIIGSFICFIIDS